MHRLRVCVRERERAIEGEGRDTRISERKSSYCKWLGASRRESKIIVAAKGETGRKRSGFRRNERNGRDKTTGGGLQREVDGVGGKKNE